MKIKILLLLIILLGFGAQAHAQAPQLFFSDLDSGPNTGGETVSGFAGSYVTLWGNFLGSSQGASTITWNGLNCLRVVSWGATRFWYQQIVVQLGASCTTGTGNFVAIVNGVSTNGIPFTVRTGHIYFVSTTGSDAANGSFATPWKTLPASRDKLVAGDIMYPENGVSQLVDDGQGWRADFTLSNNGVNGTAGNPIAVVAYPGALVTIGNASTGANFGIRTPGGSSHLGSFWTIAGLNIVGNGDSAFVTNGPVSNIRAVNLTLTDPNANGQDGGCFTPSQATFVKLFGSECLNVSSNVGGTANKEQHAVYYTTDSNHNETAWNYIHDNHSCRAVQYHSSPLGAGTGNNMFDISIHDNYILNDPCDGIAFATVDPSQGPVTAYNNVIVNAGTGPDPVGGESGDYTCERVEGLTNTGSPGGGIVNIYNETLYNCGSHAGTFGASGTFFFDGDNPSLSVNLQNIIAQQNGSEHYLGTASAGLYHGSNNIWYGVAATVPTTTGNITTNPQFVTPGTDFHLLGASPAIGAGEHALSPTLDHDGLIRPNPPSIGAYEFTSGTQTPPVAPGQLPLLLTSTSATVSWNGSPGATNYPVLRSNVSGGPYTLVATVQATSYPDTNVTIGKQYCYVIEASNSAGTSANSNEQCGTIPNTPPTPPTVTLTATPSSITSGNSSLLSVASSNATSCTGVLSACSGSITVKPSVTTTYSETATGPGGSASASATVTVTAVSSYLVNATPSSLSFTEMSGATATQSTVINDTSPNALPFLVSSDSVWLKSNVASGTTKQTIAVTASASGLSAGTYTGHIIITAGVVSNSPLSIPVTLTVTAAPLPDIFTVTVPLPASGRTTTCSVKVNPDGTFTFSGKCTVVRNQ